MGPRPGGDGPIPRRVRRKGIVSVSHNLDLWAVADIIMSEYPRITYQTSERTFDRLFKGTELPLAARFGLC